MLEVNVLTCYYISVRMYPRAGYYGSVVVSSTLARQPRPRCPRVMIYVGCGICEEQDSQSLIIEGPHDPSPKIVKRHTFSNIVAHTCKSGC